jgi:hypothetical protein
MSGVGSPGPDDIDDQRGTDAVDPASISSTEGRPDAVPPTPMALVGRRDSVATLTESRI